MSFSSDAKREMCRAQMGNPCCAVAECYGALLLAGVFRPDEIRLTTFHRDYIERIEALMKAVFGLNFDGRPASVRQRTIAVTDPRALREVRAAFGYGPGPELALHLNNAVLERECCLAAFWRGAFLSGGSVTAPETKYHLEIVTPHRHLARELAALLRESGLEGRLGERAGSQVLYFKNSESIEDFLTLAGAPVAAMAIMEAKIEKDMRNRVNRRVNCDSANVDRTLDAARRLREAIDGLAKSGRLEELPAPLRAAAEARLQNPEDSLAQLAQRLGVSKSCLNHRLRRLCALAREDGQG